MSGYRRVVAALVEAMQPDAPFALLVVRLRRLRETELSFGHAIGEQLHREIELLIRDALRPGDTLFHIGESDFAILLPAIRGDAHAELAAAKIARLFDHPIQLDRHSVLARVTVGGVVSSPQERTPEEMLMAADHASAWAIHSRHGYEMARGMELRPPVGHSVLAEALRMNALQLHLQPIREIASGRTVAYEALARWTLPDGRSVSPADFVPMAEQSGLIGELTVWSLHAAMRHLAAWSRVAPDVVCAVNVSPLFAADAGFPGLVERALSIWDVRPQQLMLEITETAFANNIDAVIESMTVLKNKGIGIGIDDFGSGYATFSYLKDFPVSELKIDRMFITDLARDTRLRHLVASMIDMAHRLDIHCVAEGVEEQDTLDVLTELGCDQVQGYIIGRPAPAEEVVDAIIAA
ncbi:putative bifunctional diguanylate cyclase/phosphodiesterase [Solilutibacter silvestris]|uniref:EAL domain n=1 Tax=Solilutibacter silvestris TaxID=1645665 RepID=A0A2K1Q3L2_9GAMM|nr:GGDEF domain-containing phosphodiesterase [Lysobacter silvestris]PNS09635.1 EAL domain [Lysobacter silvestris]